MQDGGQGWLRARSDQPPPRIAAQHTGSASPRGECPGCCRPPRQRAAPVPAAVLRAQPAAQQRKVQLGEIIATRVDQILHQRGDVTPVSPHRMRRQPTHGPQMGREAFPVRSQGVR